jgi:hypothetical protein
MKSKIAVGIVLILILQMVPKTDFETNEVLPNEAFYNSINSPQGVNSTTFMSVSSASIDTYYNSHNYTFGDHLIAVYGTGGTNPMFGGSSICGGSCPNSALYIMNYSSNSLVGIIKMNLSETPSSSLQDAKDWVLFDTHQDTLHIVPKGGAPTQMNGKFSIEWPIGSAIRNYSFGDIILNSTGQLISNNSIQYSYCINSPCSSVSNQVNWSGGQFLANASSSTESIWKCRITSIVAYSENSSILTKFCNFRITSLALTNSVLTFNITNGANGGQIVLNLTDGDFGGGAYKQSRSILMIQKVTGNHTDWTNSKLFMRTLSEPCPKTLYSLGSEDLGTYGSYSNYEDTFVASLIRGTNPNDYFCEGIAELNQTNAILLQSGGSASTGYTFAVNSSNGQSMWMANTGTSESTNNVQKQVVTNGNFIYICTQAGTGAVVNGTSVNIGLGGILKLHKDTGQYHSHIGTAGLSGGIGCSSAFSEGSDVYMTLSNSQFANGQLSFTTANRITTVRLDANGSLHLVYSLLLGSGSSITERGVVFERVTEPTIIVADPNFVNYGSGTMAGGDGFGAFFLQNDYDQDNIADGIDTDDDNDGYLDINDNCPRGMMNWNPGTSTDADSDGCHFSEDFDRDNDGIDDADDDCDSPANSFTSSVISDYDSDGCRDSTEDDDDDNDNILDVNDNCIKSANNSDVLVNDIDADGCGEVIEDFDDDNDGVFDENDNCQSYPNTWLSSSTTDHDSDGCKDSSEDNDDDNDGVQDNLDSCSTGKISWIPDAQNDADSDGCFDANEDIDDDNDGVTDSADACPKVAGDSSFGSLLGCPDTDQDGYGDNIDSCPSNYGTSFRDVYGCTDADNDGYSDDGDDFPNDASAHSDSDNDGIEDSIDQFPFLPGQWEDSDGDGYGDNPTGPTPDSCSSVFGNSTRDVYGCLDSDGDGFSDLNDKFPNNSSKWLDTDNDGVEDSEDAFPLDSSQQTDSDKDGSGDNPVGVNADKFPNDSSQWSDIDGDGFGDNPNGTNPDAFITDATQWSDADGDGYGDNSNGRLYDEFPQNPTQWLDEDGDGFGDNQNGTAPDPYLNDFDNDGYNDTIDILPKLASPGDLDADGCLDENDAEPSNSQECLDSDGDGVGDNADTDDDNDGWADTDEVRLGTDPFNSAEEPVESFEIVIPGTSVGLGAWDLIGMFGGIPLFVWITFGFATRNGRTARYEVKLRDANTRYELEGVAKQWEYSLMLRLLGPHQGIRLERLRAELDDVFEAQNQPLSSLQDNGYNQTQMVADTMGTGSKTLANLPPQPSAPPINAVAQTTDENGYEWYTLDDGTNFYRTIGSQADWVKLEN